MIDFSNLQLKQLQRLSISTSIVQNQIEKFKNGFPFLPINRPAIIGDGIMQLAEPDLAKFIALYENEIRTKSVVKFVPASGAASRMFKELFSFVESENNSIEDNKYISKFIEHVSSFAFYKLLANSFIKKEKNLNKLLQEKKHVEVINELISTDGLDYGGLPKGLLKFHTYDKEIRTSLEEHFAEGALYAVGTDNMVNLHFTVAPEHQQLFENKVAEVKPIFENKFGVKYNVTYSQQLKSTDTIAVIMDNAPFVEEDGLILFRPAGHGALLENLNSLKVDLVFIKNIDNVVPDRLKETTVRYKKAIGGVLLSVQQKVKNALILLNEKDTLKSIIDIKNFIEQELNITFNNDFKSYTIAEQTDYLKRILNRPIRVCGMVENTGEPGGGPFYVDNPDGSISLQIGEASQLDLTNEEVNNSLKNASHFNPVDLVCAITDSKGKPFNLLDYRDDDTGFITIKSKNGRDLKAQELPGLWNGAMANWITLFVEVPQITFNPVKTVNDLLREEHQ